MVEYKTTTWKELKGDYNASIVSVNTEKNNYYNPKEDNSTAEVLTIEFSLEDPETLESIKFIQKFVAPLTHGKGLFQQLLDVVDYIPDAENGSFDEQEFVGINLIATIDKNKKGYATVVGVIKAKTTTKSGAKLPPKKETKEEVTKEDLPF